MDETRPTISPAAIHEAAHELVALSYGCRDVHAFVCSRENGVCYHRLPRRRRWNEAPGIWQNDDLARVRARAAVSMAGPMGEAILEGREVPDYEALLTSEAADPVFSEFGFEYGALEEVFEHATAEFGCHHRAAEWLKAALPGVRAKTYAILMDDWPCVLRRARELDETLGGL
jgi:hypothetical protein